MVKLTEEMVIARSRISDLSSVKKLNCWGSELTDISILRELKKVEVVSLSVNNISTLQDFQHCINLKDLFVRKNNITDLNEVFYLQNLPNLRNLWLGENPCADRDDYRLAVLQILPNLEKLDDKHVSSDEINSAMSRSKILIDPLEMDSSPAHSDPTSPQEVPEYYEEQGTQRNRRYSSSSDQHSYDGTHHTHEEYHDTNRKNANYNSSLAHQYSQNNHYDYELQNGQTKNHKEEIGKNDSRSKPDNFELTKEYNDRAVNKHNGNYDERKSYNNSNYLERSSTDQRSQMPITSRSNYSSAELMDDERTIDKFNYDYENRRQNEYEESHQSHSKRSSIHEREGEVPGWVKHSEKDKCHFHYHRRPVTRNSNILSAVLCLVKELDYPSLEVVEMAVRNRMDELEE